MVSRFLFIDDHRDVFSVKRLCEVLCVARSGFYKWLISRPAREQRARADAELAERIRGIHAESGGTYGAPRITAELRDAHGMEINEKRVARVMRAFGVAGYRKRRRTVTTVPDPDAAVVPDLFRRDFTAPAPNMKYMGDITYLPVGDGEFLYLATVLDCFSRRVAGWSITDHMRTELVADALTAADALRGGLAGAVFHSDHGAQYSSAEFASLCEELGVVRSMGAVGTSADNAACESFHASLKRETLGDRRRWDDAEQCRQEVFAWLVRYNSRRRHSANAQISPVNYETSHSMTLAV
ncbi:transposase [Streptomyces sp. HG99]|nr:transposase [Streptomyces sp. HG99]